MNPEYIELANSIYNRIVHRLGSQIGNLALLVTENDTNLVDAINEIAVEGGSGGGDIDYEQLIEDLYGEVSDEEEASYLDLTDYVGIINTEYNS